MIPVAIVIVSLEIVILAMSLLVPVHPLPLIDKFWFFLFSGGQSIEFPFAMLFAVLKVSSILHALVGEGIHSIALQVLTVAKSSKVIPVGKLMLSLSKITPLLAGLVLELSEVGLLVGLDAD